jgi:hypothetical protein
MILFITLFMNDTNGYKKNIVIVVILYAFVSVIVISNINEWKINIILYFLYSCFAIFIRVVVRNHVRGFMNVSQHTTRHPHPLICT